MTITSISTATFLADAVIFLRDDIRDNVTDPISGTRNSAEKFVLTSYPRRNVTYPIVTIIDKGVSLIQRGGMKSSVTINRVTIQFRVWARNVKERDEISQAVMDRLRSIQHTSGGTNDAKLFDFTINSVLNVPPDPLGEQSTQSKIIIIEYMVILGE